MFEKPDKGKAWKLFNKHCPSSLQTNIFSLCNLNSFSHSLSDTSLCNLGFMSGFKFFFLFLFYNCYMYTYHLFKGEQPHSPLLFFFECPQALYEMELSATK